MQSVQDVNRASGDQMADASNTPFFIVGAQRSGTTMLRLMLNQHSTLAVPFESVFIPSFWHRLSEYGDLGEPGRIERLLDDITEDPWVKRGNLIPDREKVMRREPTSYRELVDAIFSAYAQGYGKSRWGDKTPGYVLEMDVLANLFPECRVIHLVRDGRDVASSLAGVSWGSRNLITNAVDWRWKTVLGRKMGNMMGARYLEVSYEDLVCNSEDVLQSICGFLGIDYEDAMLSYPESAQGEMPGRSLKWHRSSVSAPDRSKVQEWRSRMSENDQVVFEEVAGDALELFGYELMRREPTWSSRIRYARYALRARC